MRIDLSERFLAQYDATQPAVQKAVQKQLKLLVANLRHPSLHAKKYDEALDLWQARINKNWRMYFIVKNDVYRVVEMKAHPK